MDESLVREAVRHLEADGWMVLSEDPAMWTQEQIEAARYRLAKAAFIRTVDEALEYTDRLHLRQEPAIDKIPTEALYVLAAETRRLSDVADMLGEVADWLGAPDWSGPQLPRDLARRIADSCHR